MHREKTRIVPTTILIFTLALLVYSCEPLGPPAVQDDPPVTEVAAPVFSPEPGVYSSSQSLTISTATQGAVIYYTTDGSPPDASSPEYAGPIDITDRTTVQAFATKDDVFSDVISGTYYISDTNDSDGDGLTDTEEAGYGTAPELPDTDGDGLDDYREIVELGFDHTNDPYKFNPVVADVPEIDILLTSAPKISMNMSSSETSSTEITTGNTTETATTVTTSQSTTNSTTVETTISRQRKKASIGFITLPSPVSKSSYSQTTTEETSFTWSQSQAVENRQKHSEAVAVKEESGFTYDGGSLKVTTNIQNSGNISFTLANLTLSAIETRPFAFDVVFPIGNLSIDNEPTFPATTIGPGESTGQVVFSNLELDLNTALDLLQNSRGIIIKPALYEITDANGVSFTHNLTDIRARTATVIIDYGPQTIEPETYMVATNIDQNNLGTTAGEVMTNSLYITYSTDIEGKLNSVRSVNADTATNKEWLVLHFYTESGVDQVDKYSSMETAYNFDSLPLKAGNVLHLIYMNDSDEDELGIREEFFYGTFTDVADSDSDGLMDGPEAHGIEIAGITRNGATLFTDPTRSDTDGDSSLDGTEFTDGTDPTSTLPFREDLSLESDKIKDVAVDPLGNVYIVGQKYYMTDGTFSWGAWQQKKLLPDGTEDAAWNKEFNGIGGSSSEYEDSAEAVTVAPDGSIYVVGFFSEQHNIAWEQDWRIKKFYADGTEDMNWDLSIDSDGDSGIYSDDRAQDVAVDNNGYVYVVGFGQNLAGDSTGYDWWIKKFSSSGVEVTDGWNKSVDHNSGEDKATTVTVDDIGNVYVAGYCTDYEGTGTGEDWRMIKYSSSGTQVDDMSFSVGNGRDIPRDITADSSGNVYLAGSYYDSQNSYDGYLKKITGDTVAWTKRVGQQGYQVPEHFYSVCIGPYGNIYVAGFGYDQDKDALVRSFSPDGSTLYADWSLNNLGITGDDAVMAIAPGPGNEMYLGGYVGMGNDEWYLSKSYTGDPSEL